MKLLILGANGFLGSAIIKHILSFHNDQFEICKWDTSKHGDLLELKSFHTVLEQIQPDALINCAWLNTSAQNYRTNPKNIVWGDVSFKIHKFCEKNGIYIVSFGTSAEDDLNLTDLYFSVKRKTYCALLDESLFTNSAWIKPSYIFSLEHQRPNVLKTVLKHNSKINNFVLNKGQINDYIHVQDVVSAVIYSLNTKFKGSFDTVSGVRLKTIDFLNLLIYQSIKFVAVNNCFDANHTSWSPLTTIEMFSEVFHTNK